MFLVMGLIMPVFGQSVYEKGTFITLPSGKHINHSYYTTWETLFATEDGVLRYDNSNRSWQDPITASNGLIQYPALLVWQDPGNRDIWIITPDYVFVYDELTDWMSKNSLPADPKFSGTYQLGVTDTSVIVAATRIEGGEKTYAVYENINTALKDWGTAGELSLDPETVTWIPAIQEELEWVLDQLPGQVFAGGNFDGRGYLHMDAYPQRALSSVTSICGRPDGSEVFLSTYGSGVLHSDVRNGMFMPLPYGLLTPDVMTMELANRNLMVGGRGGLTTISPEDRFMYDEAIRYISYDMNFVTDIAAWQGDLLIAARGGVFRGKAEDWSRIISRNDLKSKRIYSVSGGDYGTLVVATERNAFLYDNSGLLLKTLFPEGLDWPVFDVRFEQGNYYISCYYGVYIFNEENQAFLAHLTSSGDFQSPKTAPDPDPVYESRLKGDTLWVSSGRGITRFELSKETGKLYLAPGQPFHPRGLAFTPHTVWVGTEVGVVAFDEFSLTWRNYSRRDGLISNFVTDLERIGNYIWVGTNLGLTRIKWRNL